MAKTALAIAAVGLLIACDKTPTAPTRGPEPNPPGAPTVQRLDLAGPDVVPLGGSASFTLTAVMTDGSTRDVTNAAKWQAGGGLAATSNPGTIAGVERGEGVVIAKLGEYGVQENRATKRVFVLAAGTYRLAGSITEAGAPSGPVIGALVEATTVSGTRMATYTDPNGEYVFFGISGDMRVRVSKDGYQPASQTVVVSDHTTYNVELPLLAPRAEVSGSYTLTITAADQCRVGLGEGHLPEDARVRTYQAAIEQDGPRLVVTLNAPTLHDLPIRGRVEPGRVVLDIPWAYEDGERPSLFDQLPTSGFLAIAGGAVLAVSPNRVSGTFSGYFMVFQTESIWTRAIAMCESADHKFVLSR